MKLGEFIDNYKEAIARRVVESYPPLYRPSEDQRPLPRLLRKPLGGQADAIRGAALSLETHQGTTVVGEMGTGKTFIGAAAAYMAGFQRCLILCPPHLTRKWKREIEDTVPNGRAAIVTSITDLERLRLSTGAGPLFAIMSRERAKLSYRWKPAVIERWATAGYNGYGGRLVRDEETGEPFRVPCCPTCYAQVVDKDGIPLTAQEMARKRHTCHLCRSALWQADGTGPKSFPLADYVKVRMRGFFDLLVGDEVHEYKGRGSAQGIAAGVLADACGKSLTLTGTLTGGYSSTLFHLLYRFSPDISTEFGRSEEGRWIQRYGFLEQTVRHSDDDRSFEDGRSSRRKGYRKTVRERPGLAPGALFHLIGNSVFLRLADVASGLPPYEEQVLLSGMDREPDHTGLSQRKAYDVIFDTLRRALAARFGQGLQAAPRHLPSDPARLPRRLHPGRDGLRSPDGQHPGAGLAPLRGQAVSQGAAVGGPGGGGKASGAQGAGLRHPHRDSGHHRADGQVPHPARVPGGGAEGGHGGPGPPGSLGGGEGQAGPGRAHLPSPAGADRSGPHRLSNPLLVRDRLQRVHDAAGVAALLAHRADERPVKVVFMAYRNTLQADALKLVAKKLQSSLAVEGELPEDGLAAYGDDGDDLMLALARQIVSGDEERRCRVGGGGLRPGQGRRGQRRGVPGGRRVAGGRGRAGGRSRSMGTMPTGTTRPTPSGTTVELVPGPAYANGNGHASVPANGNGAPRPSRRSGAAAVPVLLGRVHGRGAGQAQGPQEQAPAGHPLHVRVGACRRA